MKRLFFVLCIAVSAVSAKKLNELHGMIQCRSCLPLPTPVTIPLLASTIYNGCVRPPLPNATAKEVIENIQSAINTAFKYLHARDYNGYYNVLSELLCHDEPTAKSPIKNNMDLEQIAYFLCNKYFPNDEDAATNLKEVISELNEICLAYMGRK